MHRAERPRVCVTLGTVLPIMSGTGDLCATTCQRSRGLAAAWGYPTVRRPWTPQRCGASVTRLLDEPAVAAAAREVSTEMATQPSPSAVIQRLTGAMR
jgi:hypothetical protein